MARPPVAEQVQVNFRMPADLRDRIKMAAEKRNRSMNAEIVDALEDKYPAPVTDASKFLLMAVRRFLSQGRIPDMPREVLDDLQNVLEELTKKEKDEI